MTDLDWDTRAWTPPASWLKPNAKTDRCRSHEKVKLARSRRGPRLPRGGK